MSNSIDLSPLANAYQKANSVVCFIHPQATYDAVAAAVSVQQALSRAEKTCTVVCEAPMRSEYQRLMGIERVTQQLGNRDLVVSFDYSEEQVDKVSYNVNEATQRFELIIAPKAGGLPLNPQTVQFSQSGLSADIVLLFGFHSFAELGEYYEKEKYVIDGAFTVALTQSKVSPFAKLHVALQPEQMSYSEWAFYMLRQLQIAEVKDQIATGILSGIEYATDRFQDVTNARTFETMAQLMRAGGQRYTDNPVFTVLATPIRDMNAGYAPVPAATPVSPNEWTQPQQMNQGIPLNTPIKDGSGAKSVQPSEFAQAMGNRS